MLAQTFLLKPKAYPELRPSVLRSTLLAQYDNKEVLVKSIMKSTSLTNFESEVNRKPSPTFSQPIPFPEPAAAPRKLNRGLYLEIILRTIKSSKVDAQTFINDFIVPIAEKSNILKYRTLI